MENGRGKGSSTSASVALSGPNAREAFEESSEQEPLCFSLNGHELFIVQEPQSAPEESEGGTPRHVRGSLRIVGCLAVGGDTYTIFSPEEGSSGTITPPQRPIDFLTQRELQIALLVMQGNVNKQIAHRLHIAPNTVQTHLKRMFCKLGVTSRAAMVAQLAGCLHPGSRISR
jgi:DNA-binding CsgD family transcriptional regulator